MNRLRLLRESRGLSQQQLAEQIGSTQQNIHRYERDLSSPDIATLKILADFFETSIDYLVDHPVALSAGKVELSTDEADLIEKYRKLNINSRQDIQSIIDTFINRNR